ncbi:MAG: hypothetical protein JXL80_03410 [Planctomycetes bacterium]|nr:hypothetical protein [Planctomycetota bacterium]
MVVAIVLVAVALYPNLSSVRGDVSLDVPDDATVDAVVARAPSPGNYLDPALKVKLVDFIDCSKAPGEEPHPFIADTHTRVTRGGMGPYRETGTHANSWFAYRFRTGAKQSPHMVIVEYPDDAYRTACIFLHEPWMSGKFNSDYHAEGGYWTGRELPTSGKFQAIELWLWPTERWPALVVMNHTDTQRAAASRIWIYEVTGGLPAADVHEPEGLARRQIGAFFEDTRMYRYNFGSYGPEGPRRLVDYLGYAGQNLLAFDVVLYAWNKCSTEAFGDNPGGQDPTEQALVECDRAGIDFLAVFDPTAGYKIKGLPTADLTDDAVVDAWVEGIGQFIDKYGRHRSLKGISFGGPAGCNRFRTPKFTELQEKLRAMIRSKQPDIKLHVFFGNEYLHRSLFNTQGYEPYEAVIAPWESASADASFADTLAAGIDRYWREHLHMNIKDYRNRPGFVVHRSFYPNDHRCFEHYPLRTPRFMIYRDYDRSQLISDGLANNGAEGACVFGSYFEMVVPLWAPKNFWWQRTWIGPHVPAGGDHALAAYTEPLYQRDYPVMLQGSWVEPLVGHASRYRTFARAFRTLPAQTFETITRDDGIAVRRLKAGKDTWFYVLNNHASAACVRLRLDPATEVVDLLSGNAVALSDGTLTVDMAPFGLRTFKTAGATVALRDITTERDDKARDHLRERIAAYSRNLAALKQAVPTLSGKFAAVLDTARGHLEAKRYEEAARSLPETLEQELQLRLWMTRDRPKITAQKTSREIRLDGELDEWQDLPPSASLETADHLGNDHHFGHQWSGPDDLSGTVWAAYDQTNLTIAVRVRDDVVCSQDGLKLVFPSNWRSLAEGETVPGSRTFRVAAPTGEAVVETNTNGARLVSHRTEDGYAVEAAIPLSSLGATPGKSIGLHLVIEEVDFPDYPLPKFTWGRIQPMEWPVNPWWTWWRDAQCAGELHLAE